DGQFWSFDWVAGSPYHFEFLGNDASAYIPKFFKAETHDSNPDSLTLVDMIRTINQASDSEFLSAISRYLDMRRVMTHAAVEMFVGNPDEVMDNNLFLYRFEGKTLFQWLPWDQDAAFKGSSSQPVFRDRINVVLRRGLAIPETRAYYSQALA